MNKHETSFQIAKVKEEIGVAGTSKAGVHIVMRSVIEWVNVTINVSAHVLKFALSFP